MVVYYAMGGGFGHVVRARAVAHTLSLEGETTLLTAAPAAADPRVHGPLRVYPVPLELQASRDAWREWLQATLAALAPRLLFIDTFPAGILGELRDLAWRPGLQLCHVARRIRTEMLAELFAAPLPRYARTYVIEELSPAQRVLLAANAAPLVPLALRDPPAVGDADLAAIASRHGDYWLVVHSGPAGEVDELVRYAAELRAMEFAAVDLVVLTPVTLRDPPPRTFVYDAYPAAPLFPAAQRIVSAAGSNIMRQAAPWRAKHDILPFPRRFDDQSARAVRLG